MKPIPLNQSSFLLVVSFALVADYTSITSIFANSTLLAEAFEEWNSSRTGPLANIPSANIIYGRLPTNLPFDDPSPGPNTGHWELVLSLNRRPTATPQVIAAISIVSPTSRA